MHKDRKHGLTIGRVSEERRELLKAVVYANLREAAHAGGKPRNGSNRRGR